MAFPDQIVISEICTLGSMCAQETVADHEQQSMAWVMAVFLMGFSPLYEQSYNLRVPCSVPLSSFNALYCNMYLLFALLLYNSIWILRASNSKEISIPIIAFLFTFTECLQNNGLLHEIFMVHVMGVS
jgi:hypothetical protein